jgi:mRNA interferase MazF
MRRGDVIVAALPGDYGKPRPSVVVQSDRLAGTDTVLVCPITSSIDERIALRPIVDASDVTGLRQRSQIMTEKVTAIRRDKCGSPIGRIDPDTMAELGALIAFALGLGDM